MSLTRLRLPLCLLIVLSIASTALAVDLLARSKLLVAVRTMDMDHANQVLMSHSFDADTLGVALQMVANRAYPEDEEPALKMAQLLVDKGADVNYQDSEGRTPLMECAIKGLGKVARTLLLAGADLKVADQRDMTAWDHADRDSELGRDMVALLDAELEERKNLKRVCKISNLSARIKGDCVVINYDLRAPVKMPVKLIASDNNGRTYAIPVSNVTGHVGNGVAPGTGREIVWEVKKDVPGGLEKGEIVIDLLISRL